jgi:hypothetical protein
VSKALRVDFVGQSSVGEQLTPALASLNVTRQEMAHRRAARAIDAYRAYEAQSDAIFRELTIALDEQLSVNHVEMKPEKNKWMTEAYREWQVQEQVAKERGAR